MTSTRTSRRWRAAALAAAAGGALALTACGGPSGLTAASGARLAGRPGATGSPLPPATAMPTMSAMPGMSGMPASAAPAAAAAPVATDAVVIHNFAFAPAMITVTAGTTVRWINKDTDAHTVTSDTGLFGSAALPTGAGYAHTFTKPGTYSYHCSIHPFMVATVVVRP